MNQIANYDPETGELPVTTAPSQSMVSTIVKAEIDTQISTAHAYPRSVSRAMANIKSLVTISPEAAQECNYALPRGGKPITGPSVRLAEIVASQWGNSRVGARVVHVDRFEKYVEAEGVFHDLETNTATTARVRRRIVDKNGRLFNDDMIIVTGNAACSIAKRNAILGGIPKAVWNEAYKVALATIKGDVKTLPERRAAAFKAFAAFGIKPDQIYAALEIGGEEDIGLDELATLTAMHSAIKSGEQTVEDYFPPAKTAGKAGAAPEADAPKGTGDKLADIAKSGAGKSAKDAKADAGASQPAQDGAGAQGQAEATQGADEAKAAQEGPSDAQDGAANSAPAADGGQDAEHAAYERGKKAFSRGQKQDALPPDLRKNDVLSEAWTNGWKDARDASEASGGGK